MDWLHIVVLSPFIFALFVPFLFHRFNEKVHTGWFVLPIPLILFFYLVSYYPVIANGDTVYRTLSWIPSLGINFTTYLDGLSFIFTLLITGIGSLVVLYSIYYMAKDKEALHNFYIYLLLFMGAMLGLVLADNILVLYVFWELTSISSFLLNRLSAFAEPCGSRFS
uniref:NADH-Ubiquinone oxidoreductase (complex I) chain 5 N-terminal domain-containing protein n=1 Tax=Anaerobacillus isosaccharinicus TaxID=1532552 RepID=A0A7S7LBG7_9BACI|nr:hypothetical protein [Anaerobacillus isosaccharinicus]QOY37974.1 hypothetical protein AWH56_010625 [Anaerobacillus isosaccharinicus]